MDDVKTVQPEAVSTETAPKTEEPVKPPSPEEMLKQMIAQERESLKKELIEPLKRELQSTKDRHLAEMSKAQQRAREAEEALAANFRSVVGDDPDAQTKLELARFKTRETLNQRAAYEDMTRKQQEEFDKDFKESHTQFATDLGIDPNDKRIDWGDGETNYLARMKKIQKSIALIAKEKEKASEERYSSLDKRIKEMESKTKKENIEANSVDTSHASGSASEKAIRDAYIKDPYNPENRQRMNELRAKRKH